MRLIDARRLTGPNLLARSPLVLVEIALDPADTLDSVIGVYQRELARVRTALGLVPEVKLSLRAYRGGVDIAYAEPIDQMLAAAEASEWAVQSAVEVVEGRAPLPLDPKLHEIKAILSKEQSPRLIDLAVEAQRRGLPFLWDDELVTLGMGQSSLTVSRNQLPEVSAVDWNALARIPVALITGTNGKTTSSRLLARMAKDAGFQVAITSSDGIAIGGETVESGDWTGPGAARVALRRNDVDFAVLETARGGILRRGLAVDLCDAALLTNVSDDHLGLYGIDDVAAMTEVKGVVARATRADGTAVLNANDPHLMGLAPSLTCQVVFFADLESTSNLTGVLELIEAARKKGQLTVVAWGERIIAHRNNLEVLSIPVSEVPITFGGAARYNVDNALGAVATALAMGLSPHAIATALRGFSMLDNPGRGQIVSSNGVTVVLDFGHNPEGVRAVMSLVSSLRNAQNQATPALGRGRLTVITASPGDRSDGELEAVAHILYQADPHRIIVRELDQYLRGRAHGDVTAIFRKTFLTLGLPAQSFSESASEVLALTSTFADTVPGDFVVVLVHLEKDQVQNLLRARGPASTVT